MNISQILEGVIAKNVLYCDEYLRNYDNSGKAVKWISENILKFIGNEKYYKDSLNLSEILKNDKEQNEKFLNLVRKNNFYIECPSFGNIDIHNLIKHSVKTNEPVLLKKELLKYMRQKLGINLPFTPEDKILKSVFCAPIYTMKLYKLVSHLITARDFGPCKMITRQP